MCSQKTKMWRCSMENKEIKILIADDEREIRNILRILLSKKGYGVVEASGGQEAVEAVKDGGIDLVLMDIMMPRMNGIEATAKIREFSTVPVLFLTAKSLDSDKESAYLGGGDDYLTKPFSTTELMLKVESLLRRYMIYKGKEDKTILNLCSSVEVDLTARTVKKHGEPVALRERETEILFYLLDNKGSVVETARLYEAVWQEKAMSSSANNVMVNILNLRKKLEDDPAEPKLIKTVWGRGYRID
ncbi:MAG: response regulator transcription factor [Clostridia bacterium]|nr:response regulator transcription factor [Clostridia bacterium]